MFHVHFGYMEMLGRYLLDTVGLEYCFFQVFFVYLFLVILSIIENEVLMSSTIIVELFISPSILSVFGSYTLGLSY